MLNDKVASLLNEQINKELYSSYLYLGISSFYEKKGLKGFANWFKIQAQEELDHGMLMYQYLHNNNASVSLEAIAKPDMVLNSLEDGLEVAYTHEQKVTASINAIYAAAMESKDFRSMQFLDWFVKEQGEEETNTSELVSKMELFGSDSKALYMLDNELGARVYTAPSLVL